MKASLNSLALTATLLTALLAVTKLSGAVIDMSGTTRVSDGNGGYTYPTWKPMLGPGAGYAYTDSSGYLFDPLDDQQTGQNQSDFASQAGQPGFFVQFGTINGIEHIAWRVLMNEYHGIDGTGGPGTYSDISFGLDGDLDGTTDLFVKLNQTNNHVGLGFNGAGTGANVSPNTTTWGNLFYPTIAQGRLATSVLNNQTNGDVLLINGVAPTAGNGVNSTNFELNATNVPLYYPGWTTKTPGTVLDAVLSFAVPLADFNAALAVENQGFTINSTSYLRWVAVTATQGNSINQDSYGTDKASFKDSTWSSYATPMNGSGSPVPESGSYGLLLGAGLGGLWFFKRTGLRSSAHAHRYAS